jgi:transposase
VPIPHDATLYRQRHRIETMFGRLKDWRRIATRDDRCATIFSAPSPSLPPSSSGSVNEA